MYGMQVKVSETGTDEKSLNLVSLAFLFSKFGRGKLSLVFFVLFRHWFTCVPMQFSLLY